MMQWNSCDNQELIKMSLPEFTPEIQALDQHVILNFHNGDLISMKLTIDHKKTTPIELCFVTDNSWWVLYMFIYFVD